MTRIRLEYHGHVAYITLDHPPANTWTLASLKAFLQMMVELDGRPDVVALVIRGAGEKFFCAGADLKMFADGSLAHAREVAEAFGHAFEALARFHGVSIAAINGYAMGGGSKLRWPATSASPSSRPSWGCQRPRWVCCPAPAAPSASPSWWGRAGPSG